MSNGSRQPRYFRRRRRGPVVLGTAAVASVVMLAMSGLFLVGLDTVSSQGQKLTRITQPELAQAPEVTSEENSREESSGASDSEDAKSRESSGEAEKKQSEDGSGKDSGKEEPKDEKSGEDKAKKEEYEPPEPNSNRMWMSVPRLGMQGDTVYNDNSMATMDVGAMKLPPTGFPWQDNANTYITAHRIGYPGTQSHNQFYNLPAMQQGDVIYLGDANGTTYEYRVSEKFAVHPDENWVTEPQPEGDMVTLQTCVVSPHPSDWWDITPAIFELGPDSGRLIVQAEKVETYPPQQ